MEKFKIDNLDEQPISFDLTDEDIESIKGGLTTIDKISSDTLLQVTIKIPPIRIHPIRICPNRIFVIEIKAAPPTDPLEII